MAAALFPLHLALHAHRIVLLNLGGGASSPRQPDIASAAQTFDNVSQLKDSTSDRDSPSKSKPHLIWTARAGPAKYFRAWLYCYARRITYRFKSLSIVR